MEGSKPAATPMNQKSVFYKEDEAEKVDDRLYRSFIDCLMYLSATMPNILHTKNFLLLDISY